MNRDMLWIEANMNKFKGRHWEDPEKKARFMEYRGVTFRWDADREVWVFEEGKDEC